jgi:hypothetical protein
VFELYLSHTSGGEHSTDPRNRFHEVALRESRYASEWHGVVPARSVAMRPGFVSRLRLALAGGSASTTQACNCPA